MTESRLRGAPLLALAFAVLMGGAQAQTVWTGATDTNWSTGSNWTAGAPDGVTGAVFNATSNVSNQPNTGVGSLPTIAFVRFENTYIGDAVNTATLDASLTVSGEFRLEAGAGGDFNTGGGNSLAVSGVITLNSPAIVTLGGTVTCGGLVLSNGLFAANSGVTVSGLIDIQGGTLSGTTITANGNLTATSGDFTATALQLTGGAAQILTDTTGGAGLDYGNLTVNNSNNGVTLAGTSATAGTVTLTNGSFTLNGQQLTIDGGGAVLSAATGTLDGDTGTVVLTGAVVTVPTAGVLYENVQLNGPGPFTLGGTLSATGNVTLSSGTFDLNGNDLGVGDADADTLTLNGGALDASTGAPTISLFGGYTNGGAAFTAGTGSTLRFDGAGAQAFVPGSHVFNTVQVNKGGGVATIANGAGNELNAAAVDVDAGTLAFGTGGADIGSGGYDQSGGAVSLGSGTLLCAGNWNVTGGTFDGQTSTVELDGAAQSVRQGGNAFNALRVNGTLTDTWQDALRTSGRLDMDGGSVTLAAVGGTIGDDLDVTSGLLTASGGTLGVGGNLFAFAGGTSDFTTAPTQVTLTGASTTITPGGSFAGLVLNGSGVATTASPLTLTGALNVTAGTLDLGAPAQVALGTTVAAGATLQRTAIGTMHQFSGANTINGTFSFVGSQIVIEFEELQTTAVGGAGTFLLTGTTPGLANFCTLRDTANDQDNVRWILNPAAGATITVDRCRIQDSDGTNNALSTADRSQNVGGTTINWTFNAKTTTWTNGGADTLWSSDDNWTEGQPFAGDSVTFNAVGGASTMDVNAAFAVVNMTNFTGVMTLAAPFQAGTVTLAGSVVPLGQPLTVTGATNNNGFLAMTIFLDTVDFQGDYDGTGRLDIGIGSLTFGGDTVDFGTSEINGTGGTLLLDGGNQVVTVDANDEFPNSTFSNTSTTVSSGALNVDGSLTVNSALSLGPGSTTTISGNFDMNAGALSDGGGRIQCSGDWDTTGAAASVVNAEFVGGSAQQVTQGSVAFNSLLVNKVAGTSATWQSALDIDLTLNVASGIANLQGFGGDVDGRVTINDQLTGTGGTLTVGGDWNATGGTFATAVAVDFDGAGGQTVTPGVALLDFGTVTFSGGGTDAFTAAVDATTLNANAGIVQTGGTTTLGTLTVGAGATFDAGTNAVIVNTDTTIAGELEVDGGTTDLNGTFTPVATGTIDHNGGRIHISGTPVDFSGLAGFDGSPGTTVEFDGVVAQTVTGGGGEVFANLEFDNPAGVSLGASTVVTTEDVTIALGRTLTTGAGSLTVGRDLMGPAGSLNAATSTLVSVGRNLDVAAYTPGALLRFTGMTDATWTDTFGNNFGVVEVSGNKTVSLLPATGALSRQVAGLTVDSMGTLDMNGNPIGVGAAGLLVGGATPGTLANGVAPVRSLTVAGSVNLGTNATVTSGFRIDLGITGAGTFTANGMNTVFNGVLVSTGGTVNGAGPLQVGAGGLYLTGGNLAWGAADLNVPGNVGLGGGTFTMNPANTLTIAPTAAPAAFDPGANPIQGALVIAGTQPVTANTNPLQIGTGPGARSDFTLSGVLVTHQDMTIWGSSQINGDWDLSRPGITVGFGDGQTSTWSPTSNVHMDGSSQLTLRSTTQGMPWNLDIQAGAAFDLTGSGPFPNGPWVMDSNAGASGQTPLTGSTGADLSGNTNWPDLQRLSSTWTGGANGDW
ncbi:hypothetical protein OAX78_01060, partial [Planctomycetota bacterium]|nr:hypothetical protein [Planctomycetota bacterium]